MAATVSAILSALFRSKGGSAAAASGPAGAVHEPHESCCGLSNDVNRSVGFARAEMFSKDPKGTVSAYDRHVFVSAGHAADWPAKSLSEFPLAEQLAAAAPRNVKVTLFEDEPGTPARVLVFPPLVAVTAAAAAIASKTILEGQSALGPGAELLSGMYFFVCSHQKRDARCGACGPQLVAAIKRATEVMRIEAEVFKCSHIGGHDMAGNVLVFYRDTAGHVHGDWFGYVTPESVVDVIAAARKGEVFARLWRGSMTVGTTVAV